MEGATLSRGWKTGQDRGQMDGPRGDWWGDSEGGAGHQQGGVGERLTKVSHTGLLQA